MRSKRSIIAINLDTKVILISESIESMATTMGVTKTTISKYLLQGRHTLKNHSIYYADSIESDLYEAISIIVNRGTSIKENTKEGKKQPSDTIKILENTILLGAVTNIKMKDTSLPINEKTLLTDIRCLIGDMEYIDPCDSSVMGKLSMTISNSYIQRHTK